jgi:hypothetical protein
MVSGEIGVKVLTTVIEGSIETGESKVRMLSIDIGPMGETGVIGPMGLIGLTGSMGEIGGSGEMPMIYSIPFRK